MLARKLETAANKIQICNLCHQLNYIPYSTKTSGVVTEHNEMNDLNICPSLSNIFITVATILFNIQESCVEYVVV